MSKKCPKCNADNPYNKQFCGDCGTQLPSLKDVEVTETLETPKEELTTGSTFAGRYQIIEELGRGGMGRVYKATDTKIYEKVALKLIKPEIASDKKTLERFGNELKIARKIIHKNVGRMYDINEEKGTHYITMEYVSGQDLKGFIRQSGQMGVGTAISIIKQVCDGLSEAHKTGVTHRDLKPSSIMIDQEGNVRIMDFGIARSLKEKGITGAGVMIGTPDYMSPEQAEVKEVDQRSDIYSLGVILYEMVTGRVPFEGDTALSIAMKHKSEAPKNPKEYNAQIPDDLSELILKCLEKDKGNRYQSAGELHSELNNIEKGIPTTGQEIPRRKPLTSKEITVTVGLKKLLVPALIFISIVIIAVVIWQVRSEKGAIPSESVNPSIAVLPFKDLSPQKDQAHYSSGIPQELVLRLNNLENLWIPAWASSSSFDPEEIDFADVDRKLNVKTVLTGTLLKAEDKLRITVELINIADNSIMWSQRYEYDEGDIFELQDEVTLAIIDELKVKLMGEERGELIKRHTENHEAYNLYLLGRHFLNTRTEEGLKKGLDYFIQAIDKDPDYALAYAGLADSYIFLAGYEALGPKDAYPKAKVAALRALEIDDMLADAYVPLAVIRWEYELNPIAAEKGIIRAIEINPGLVRAHKFYAELLSTQGRHEEAIKEIDLAQQLDPLSPLIGSIAGSIYYAARKYDRALEQCRKVLEMEPNFLPAHEYLGKTYIQISRYEDAIFEFQKTAMLSSRSPLYIAGLAHAYAVAGKEQEAHKIIEELRELSKKKHVSSYSMALIYVGLNDMEKAFYWLEKAVEERGYRILTINVDPRFDSLHSDPRYRALVKKLNSEQ